jgi:hypothetical protein
MARDQEMPRRDIAFKAMSLCGFFIVDKGKKIQKIPENNRTLNK